MDIDTFDACRLINLEFPEQIKKYFLGPQYGITGMRKYTKQYNKPFSGAIVKPKTGMNADVLLNMVKELVEGDIDFIKEDEIMSNPSFCPIETRVPLIANYLNSQSRKIIYAVCINGDHDHILKRAQTVAKLGGNAIHINHWAGLGVYNAVRKLNLPLFIHFQKSGDKVFTDPRHNFGIDWNVICNLAGMMGVDSIHAGMWGGYLNDDEIKLKKIINILHNHNVVPALSCECIQDLFKLILDNLAMILLQMWVEQYMAIQWVLWVVLVPCDKQLIKLMVLNTNKQLQNGVM